MADNFGVNLGLFGADPRVAGSIPAAQNEANNIADIIGQAVYGSPTAPAQTGAFPTGTNQPAQNTSGGGAVGGQTTSPDYSQLINQYNARLGDLTNTQNAGNTQIDNSYNTAIQQLLGQKNLGQQGYDTSKQNSATGYVGAKNTIGTQAGQTLNGLLRLLGSRGAGGGISDVLRQAVARNASIQRNDVGKTFGQNQQALNQNWGQYMQNYNDQVGNVGIQRQQNKESLANQIAQGRADINTSIAGLQSSPTNAQPYLDTANNILAKLSNYVAPSFNYTTTPYQAPTAASYTTAPAQAVGYGSNTATNDYASPYLQTLLGKKQQQFA